MPEVWRYETDFDSLHQSILVQHAHLTNGTADFVSTLGASLASILDKLEGHLDARKSAGSNYDYFHARQYVELLKLRADAEMVNRQGLLDRIEVYLQVVCSVHI
jgi:hypothetical protein